MSRPLDVICLGRAAVDLYGQQRGGRFEDVQSFSKYVGGSSCNVSVGLARLGRKSSMLTRVGDEQMGRFVREQLVYEGVDVSHLSTDPERLTALVLLGIASRDSFPHIFYRENCADMAMSTSDFDADFVGSSRVLAITGTHLSTESTAHVVATAIEHAKARGTRIVLDIDYRPVLWGRARAGDGDDRTTVSTLATTRLQAVLPHCDLVVGTEEELQAAGGDADTDVALARVRSLTSATVVVKRGAAGCTVFPLGGEQTDVRGFPVEVLNTLGAGDAFLSGFLAGWLEEASWRRCGELGNACGALTVSRHGCAPAFPTRIELDAFLRRSNELTRPDLDAEIEHLHAATTTRRPRSDLYVLAFDHRRQLEQLAGATGASLDDIPRFKALVADAVEVVAKRTSFGERLGVIVDDRYGEDVLSRVTHAQRWVGRALEIPGSRPVEFDPRNHSGLPLQTWPSKHVVKLLVVYHPDDPLALRLEQEDRVRELYRDTVELSRELLLEIVAGTRGHTVNETTVSRVMQRFYNVGVRPAWWKLEPQTPAAWENVVSTIEAYDPHCNGVLLLGLDAPEPELEIAFQHAAPFPLCRGFAVGRSIFGQPAREWMSGRADDAATIAAIAERYERLIRLWRKARGGD